MSSNPVSKLVMKPIQRTASRSLSGLVLVVPVLAAACNDPTEPPDGPDTRGVLLPPEIGNLSKLVSLALSGNELTGPVPPQFGNLESLRYLLLDRNNLERPAPAGIDQPLP